MIDSADQPLDKQLPTTNPPSSSSSSSSSSPSPAPLKHTSCGGDPACGDRPHHHHHHHPHPHPQHQTRSETMNNSTTPEAQGDSETPPTPTPSSPLGSGGDSSGGGGGGGEDGVGGRPILQWSSSMLQSISEEEVLDLMEGRNLKEIMSSMPPCQCDDCLLNEEGEDGSAQKKPLLKRQSSWKKIRSIVRWSPFVQVFKKHRYPWIQLAGHQGNFQAGDAGCVLKKLDKREHQSLQKLMTDCLQPFVPQFTGITEKDGEKYIQLQDLLCEFNSPCVMDVKMGVRTFLEAEIMAAKHSPTLRKDMYKKMTEVNPEAPTAEEHAQKAVTKHRYMQWRDQMSSSADLGFRIEGIKNCDGSSNKDFKTTKSRDSVADVFRTFFGDRKALLAGYLQRLQDIAATQQTSGFFQSHEVIGSSLLFVHDTAGMVGVWMIDFGKTQPLPEGVNINHRATWHEGNHEDGYLLGLDNIVSILQELLHSCVE